MAGKRNTTPIKAKCSDCGSEMKVEIFPCGRHAFIEADCSNPECGFAREMEVTASTRLKMQRSGATYTF